jgi:hypothetical protein
MPDKAVKTFIKMNGWKWHFVEEPPIVVKRQSHFRYGNIELLCPQITMYRT